MLNNFFSLYNTPVLVVGLKKTQIFFKNISGYIEIIDFYMCDYSSGKLKMNYILGKFQF